VNQLDLSAKYRGVKKWKIVILNDKFDAACITGDAVLQRTGAYPAAVPRSLNIPFSDNLTEKAAEYYYDWKKDFGDYISSDPSQGNLSDFSVSTLISGRERTARNIFSYLQIIAVDYEAMGKKITNGKITSEDNSDVVKELINLYPECSKVKWAADISNFNISGVIVSDPRSEFCSTYPHTVPENMNISYDEKLLEYASDFRKNWMDDFSSCVTDDQEQLKYAEISAKVPTANLNSYAKTIFTAAQTIMQEYETKGITVDFDGAAESEAQHMFAEELQHNIPAEIYNKNLKWEIKSRDNVVQGVIISDPDATGAFPNAVPVNMRIPYSDEMLKYSYGSSDIWTEKYSDCVLENAEEDIPEFISSLFSWTKKAYVNSCNANAKSVFIEAQTVLQNMETAGEKAPEGKIITSDDDTEIVKKIKSLLYGAENHKWAVYHDGYIVKGTVFSSAVKNEISGYQSYDTKKDKFVFVVSPNSADNCTGSYPNNVPADMIIEYNHNLVNRYSEKSDTWNWTEIPDKTTPEQNENNEDPGSLSQTSKALINSYNASAKTMFTTASYIALEHEITGDVLPDGLITSDDKSAVSAEINSSVTGSGTRKWSALARNGEIIGLVYTENGNLTGSYPAPVTGALKYEHALAMRYGSNKTDW